VSKKHFYLGPSIILFNEDTKMWKIHVDTLEMSVILPIKKEQGEVFKEDSVLCHLRYFPATSAGKEDALFLCKFLGFHTFIVCCFSFFADT
jgi:hypothetical protein